MPLKTLRFKNRQIAFKYFKNEIIGITVNQIYLPVLFSLPISSEMVFSIFSSFLWGIPTRKMDVANDIRTCLTWA
jgi:hypothetical protein